jgi:hypothetical protein
MSDFQNLSHTRNPVTHETHRRQVFQQITIPLIVGVTLFVAFSVLVVLSEPVSISRWADISLIWLLTCPIVLSLVLVVLLAALVYGMWKILQALPPFAYRVQNFFVRAQMKVQAFSNMMVEPVLKIRAFFAEVRAFRRSISSNRKQSPTDPPERKSI